MILTVDEGTTSTRALMIGSDGAIIGIEQREFKQIFQKPGWVEHDPVEIWNCTLEACRTLIQRLIQENKISKDDIKGIAITNQRETTIMWDKRTGKPVYNAIVWQCRRTSELCSQLKDDNLYPGFVKLVREKTGLLVDSYFSGPKIHWILNYLKKEYRPKEIEDNILFGTVDTWLIWNFTHGSSHYTEATNACRTMVYDIHEDKWEIRLLNALKIPVSILPKVIPSNGDFGYTDLFKDLIGNSLQIKAVLGDQQAALYGYDGAAKITYGTGTFALIPITQSLLNSHLKNTHGGLIYSTAFQLKNDKKTFATEGSVFIGGAIVQWLRDGLQIISRSSEVENLASSVEDSGGVYFIPALAGLGAPFWKQDIRGTIFGITRGTTKAHIARAALESIAYRVRDVFEALEDEKSKLEHVNIDGGASKNDRLMQFQADLLQIPLHRYKESEMTALGVAKMTGEVNFNLVPETIFTPKQNLDYKYEEWKHYLNILLSSSKGI